MILLQDSQKESKMKHDDQTNTQRLYIAHISKRKTTCINNPQTQNHTQSRTCSSYLIKAQIFSELAGQLRDARDGPGGVVEVIHHDDGATLEEELQHGVAADVACATSDQDAPGHGGSGESVLHAAR